METDLLQSKIVKVVRAQLTRRIEDNQSIKDGESGKYSSLLVLWHSIVEDLFLSYEVSPLPYEVSLRWLTKMSETDINDLASGYGQVLSLLRRATSLSEFAGTFKGFRATCGAMDAYAPILHYVRNAPDTHHLRAIWFRVLTQIMSFPFRANLNTPSLKEAWIDYLRVDDSCVTPSNFVVKEMRIAFSYLIGDIDLSTHRFTPRHGPGSIAEWDRRYSGETDLRSKYVLANVPQIVAYSLKKSGISYRDYGFDDVQTRFPCRFKPVPKSIGKVRTICIEPAGMQFYQQGLRNLLEEVIGDSRLRKHVDFRDTSKSVHLAKQGSIDGTFSTIDLSNASDRIPYTLACGVFDDTPLGPLIRACRSHTVRYGQKEHKLKKLHTSGSAACFPTETLLFSLMCQVAIWRTNKADLKRSAQHDFAVFGDDIVISTPCVPALLEVLAECGSKVNESKSFVNSKFTECCGFEFYDGKDVTPLRIPRKYNLWDIWQGQKYYNDVESFDQCIDFANKCKDYDFLTVRGLFIRAVFDRSRGFVNPSFGNQSIHSEWLVNDHLRVNKQLTSDYQRLYLDCLTVVACPERETRGTENRCDVLSPRYEDSDIDLLHWFVLSDLRPEDALSYGSAVLERRSKTFKSCPFPRDMM